MDPSYQDKGVGLMPLIPVLVGAKVAAVHGLAAAHVAAPHVAAAAEALHVNAVAAGVHPHLLALTKTLHTHAASAANSIAAHATTTGVHQVAGQLAKHVEPVSALHRVPLAAGAASNQAGAGAAASDGWTVAGLAGLGLKVSSPFVAHALLDRAVESKTGQAMIERIRESARAQGVAGRLHESAAGRALLDRAARTRVGSTVTARPVRW